MDTTAFYNRILNNQETKEDVQKFYNMCENYSDLYKDKYGIRPRGEGCKYVNAYSGTPDIEEFRKQLKRGINYLMRVYNTPDDCEDDYVDYQDDYEEDFLNDEEEHKLMDGHSSKEQILSKHPEYEQYFV